MASTSSAVNNNNVTDCGNKWTNAEDSLLLKRVQKYGSNNWLKVSNKLMSGKTGSQCQQRWLDIKNRKNNTQFVNKDANISHNKSKKNKKEKKSKKRKSKDRDRKDSEDGKRICNEWENHTTKLVKTKTSKRAKIGKHRVTRLDSDDSNVILSMEITNTSDTNSANHLTENNFNDITTKTTATTRKLPKVSKHSKRTQTISNRKLLINLDDNTCDEWSTSNEDDNDSQILTNSATECDDQYLSCADTEIDDQFVGDDDNHKDNDCGDKLTDDIVGDNSEEVYSELMDNDIATVVDHSVKNEDKPVVDKQMTDNNSNHLLCMKTDNKLFDFEPKFMTKHDVATDSRFRVRAFGYTSIDKKTGLRKEDTDSLELNKKPVDEVIEHIIVMCYHCEKRFNTRSEFLFHYKSRHENTKLPNVCLKYKTLEAIPTVNPSPNDQITTDTNIVVNTESQIRSMSSKSVVKTERNYAKKSITVPQRLKSTPTNCQSSSSTSVQNTSGLNKFQMCAQCTICSFMPLDLQPLQAIKDHLINEHSIVDYQKHIKWRPMKIKRKSGTCAKP
ncbi:myb-like protein M [Oppia nitens]|uniref:myb-like protein M n=1 Tax=Oppia nitens TaxID=1686743 RepID=UPI0023D9CE00|nr:myb-like protein M [Oppia nitens]